MDKDLLLGSFSNYDYDQIQYWVNSIKMSGFTGDIVVFVGNATFACVETLLQKGIKIVALEKDDESRLFVHRSAIPIQTERFFHFWNFLKDRWQDYRYVITTDMKDVIFQNNPSDYVVQTDIFPIIVGSECLTYENEPWGRENLQQAFGSYFYESFKDWEIANVGVIAGQAEYMKDLCLHIFQMSVNRPIPIVEQAAFNFLAHTIPWENEIDIRPMSLGFVAHLGTIMDPNKIDQFEPFLLEDIPYWEDGKLMVVGTEEGYGHEFCMIHQWDRLNQECRNMLMERYGDK